MPRGKHSPIKGYSSERAIALGAALGGGAAANGTLPTNGQLIPTAGKYPKGENLATSLTYNAATGKYYMIFSESAKHILYADAVVVAAGGAPTAALTPVVVKIDPTTRRVDFNVYTPAGVLTDMGTSDLVIVRCEVADTTSIG